MDDELGRWGSPFHFEEFNSCSHLFLVKIYEPKLNCLRLIIREGKTSKVPVPVKVAGVNLGEGFPVEIDDSCATYQLEWTKYVLYQVLNEMFATVPEANEIYAGKLARTYTSSRLLQSVLGRTDATNEYPGKLLHYEVICTTTSST